MPDEILSNDRLLTRQEVEQRFGLSRRFLELSAHHGGGPVMVRLGRRSVRYRACDIAAWIEQQRVAPGRMGRDR